MSWKFQFYIFHVFFKNSAVKENEKIKWMIMATPCQNDFSSFLLNPNNRISLSLIIMESQLKNEYPDFSEESCKRKSFKEKSIISFKYDPLQHLWI